MALSRRIILDSGGLSALADRSMKARMALAGALKEGTPMLVPAVVLTESLTGTSRDARTNAALASTTIMEVDEQIARSAAFLRHKRHLRRGATIDAIVVACADAYPGSVIFTGDAKDLRPLVDERRRSYIIEI